MAEEEPKGSKLVEDAYPRRYHYPLYSVDERGVVPVPAAPDPEKPKPLQVAVDADGDITLLRDDGTLWFGSVNREPGVGWHVDWWQLNLPPVAKKD